ncbi:cellulose synthase complex periplasmic endoglucanase BcsZ [Burkholderia glumae]|uniref:cellulase n=1 Tax=Burkholderia glumae TaxID=337 RepID=A0AAP9XYN2_BURGL|nr:cellulose synthase complex periplasmic endoglucanase BcsZ [Burkholderia glumae]ACR32438.1 Cellulase [Burkholderia glumae BGR1]AJY63105.1 glycosyl hydrolases 8 family protein [Burkholderia glumae LMG 2196 = ATCC 33617]MCM2484368.1 cellulose synthase complex periplasmic endoglucanase BcsZ [Burkholderia glumae]MCM2510060.1 cellulose synthase complex periplasmic endoglucanase BcsZ [Burkholderia glumae]MCM2539822.1 cellulose synthase complex periplasmic endoglucanase BcsZ [Burkholderia glumae]
MRVLFQRGCGRPRPARRPLAALTTAVAGLGACLGAAGAGHVEAAPPAAAHPQPAAARCGDWSAYRAFIARNVQPDGRVFDASTPAQQSTSEGQSYGLFFALVANDRDNFERILGWIRENLAGGHFSARDVRLPAWLWGRKGGAWGVLDPNSASDSDLWIAYDLLEAGRLWHVPDYTALGTALAAQVVRREVVDLAGLGPMLLPGPQGFVNGDVTRLNPSYLPLPVLRGLATQLGGDPWNALASNGLKLVAGASPHGFAPDWAAWRAGQVVVDPKTGDLGSYDAIRVYLWAGLANPADPLAKPWLDAVRGMAARVAQTGVPPEKVAVATGVGSGEGPLSYWGALAPYFAALGDTRGLALARSRLTALDGEVPGHEPVYYDRVLGLFGAGAVAGRYHFDASGRLVPAWSKACR